MSRYLLLLHEEPATEEAVPEEIGAIIAEYVAWREKVAAKGQLLGGEKLTDEGGRLLSAKGEGVEVVDGPYAEAKEVLGGFFMIEAADYDAAVELASDCPHLRYGLRIEVRAIEDVH